MFDYCWLRSTQEEISVRSWRWQQVEIGSFLLRMHEVGFKNRINSAAMMKYYILEGTRMFLFFKTTIIDWPGILNLLLYFFKSLNNNDYGNPDRFIRYARINTQLDENLNISHYGCTA
jgi:hypothetical protein